VPTLVEWDTDVPELECLLEEAREADRIAGEVRVEAHAAEPVPAFGPATSDLRELASAQEAFAEALFDVRRSGAIEFRLKDPAVAPLGEIGGDNATALFPPSRERRAGGAGEELEVDRSAALKRHSRAGGNPILRDDQAVQAVSNRLAIYRGNLTANWTKALSSAYPVIHQLLGPDFFEGLARAYGKSHPSQNADLNRFGAHFADFLATFEHVAEYPYLPDMARLEWQVHLAHYASDAPVLDGARLASLTPAGLETVRFELHAACALFASDWSVPALWFAHQPNGQAFPDEMHAASHALVTRPRWQVQVHALSPAAHAALALLSEGKSFGEALDAAFALDENFELADKLKQWLGLGIFAGMVVE
jgi:hypothetical protein